MAVGAQPTSRLAGAYHSTQPCSSSRLFKDTEKQRAGKHSPAVLNPRSRARSLEEFPGVPVVPPARHSAMGDVVAGGCFISTSCESRCKASPQGTGMLTSATATEMSARAGSAGSRACFGMDGGTWLEHRVWAHVPSACPRRDRTPMQRELATSQPWSLILIFASKPPPLLCSLPRGSRFWLLSGSLRNFPCTERASPVACVILLCLQQGRRIGGVLGTAGLRGGHTRRGWLWVPGQHSCPWPWLCMGETLGGLCVPPAPSRGRDGAECIKAGRKVPGQEV